MARYAQRFKDRAVARLLLPESASVEVVSWELGVGATPGALAIRGLEPPPGGAEVDRCGSSGGGDHDRVPG
jgi:hypothetical protein